ncbi:MAG: TrkA family potassium uptake protein [Anaerolineaceae bacterium]|jgi:trk system potassium uptake protein TrkA
MKVMIVGGGKVGTYLADKLIKEKHEVRLIELREEEREHILLDIPKDVLVIGNGTDPDVLEAAGIRNMNVVAAVTGDDETNLVVTTLARFEFMAPRTIARVNHPKNAWLFNADMGVDVAINQADLLSALILEEMSMGDMVTLQLLRKGDYLLVEEKVAPKSLAFGKKVSELQFPKQSNLVSVIRNGEMILPHGDMVFQVADEVLAVVHQSEKKALARLFNAVP